MRPMLVLQHHPIETPGVFGEMLAERGFDMHTVRTDLGQPVPSDPGAFAGVIAMGGPMGVYEEEKYPWLREEDRLLRAAISRDQPMLGICLGSQLIAKAAGARVAPGLEKEIGWYPLTLAQNGQADSLFAGFPKTFDAFEWHGDIFDLPPGAVSLASSARYPHQAFRIGQRVYGLLFHLEVTAPMVRAMADTFRVEIASLGDPSRVDAILADLDRRTAPLNAHARRLFGCFLSLITPHNTTS